MIYCEPGLRSSVELITGDIDWSEVCLFWHNGRFTVKYKDWVLQEIHPCELAEEMRGCCDLYNRIFNSNAYLQSNFALFYNKETGKIENNPKNCGVWANKTLWDLSKSGKEVNFAIGDIALS